MEVGAPTGNDGSCDAEEGYAELVIQMLAQPSPVRAERFSSQFLRSESRSVQPSSPLPQGETVAAVGKPSQEPCHEAAEDPNQDRTERAMQRRWMGLVDRAQQTAAAAGDAKILRHEEKASLVVSPASSRGLEEHHPSFLSLQGEAERFLATQSRLDHKELTAMELYLNKELQDF